VQITDKNDIDTLISIYPACDGCYLMRVNESNNYFGIGSENKKKLVEILKSMVRCFRVFKISHMSK
jgi:hypothetical protein